MENNQDLDTRTLTVGHLRDDQLPKKSEPYKNLGKNLWRDISPGLRWILVVLLVIVVSVLTYAVGSAVHTQMSDTPNPVYTPSTVNVDSNEVPYAPQGLAYQAVEDFYFSQIYLDPSKAGFCTSILQDENYNFEGLAELIRLTYGRNFETWDVVDAFQYVCLNY